MKYKVEKSCCGKFATRTANARAVKPLRSRLLFQCSSLLLAISNRRRQLACISKDSICMKIAIYN